MILAALSLLMPPSEATAMERGFTAEYLSTKGDSGVFFKEDSVSIGSVIRAGGGVVTKGAEATIAIHPIETKTGTCWIGKGYSIFLPKRELTTPRVSCGRNTFSASTDHHTHGVIFHLIGRGGLSSSPKWYEYNIAAGLKKISFDPRGIGYNSLTLRAGTGLRATGCRIEKQC